MDVFDQVLLNIYRAARELNPDVFQDYALLCVRRTLNVESAVWGSGSYDGVNVLPTRVTLAETPLEALIEWSVLSAHDKVIPLVLANYGRTCEFHAPTFFAQRQDRLLREHTKRWGRQAYLVTAIPDPNPELIQWFSFYRPNPDHQFTAQQRALCERLVPHYREALSINLALHLAAVAPQSSDTGPAALVDAEGFVRQASPGVVEMLAMEWPQCDGRRLPRELRSSSRYPWTHVGRRICAEGRPLGRLALVRLRRKCAVDSLSPRQAEIATLFAGGMGHKEIARRLGLMPTTVRNHLAASYRALAISSRDELRRQFARAPAKQLPPIPVRHGTDGSVQR